MLPATPATGVSMQANLVVRVTVVSAVTESAFAATHRTVSATRATRAPRRADMAAVLELEAPRGAASDVQDGAIAAAPDHGHAVVEPSRTSGKRPTPADVALSKLQMSGPEVFHATTCLAG